MVFTKVEELATDPNFILSQVILYGEQKSKLAL